MKIKWYKQLSIVLAVALLVSVFPAYNISAETGKVATTIHLVNKDDVSLISVANSYISNAYITASADSYELEVEVSKDLSLVFEINGSIGEVVEEKEGTFVRAYQIDSKDTPFEAVTKYKITPESAENTHSVLVVLGNDIDATKTQLSSAIEVAKKLTDRSEELNVALSEAEEANTFVTLLAVMQSKLQALQAEINKHGAVPTPEPVDPTAVTLSYVDANNKSSSFNSRVDSFVLQANVETRSRSTYLIIKHKKNFDFSITVNNSVGKINDDTSEEYKIVEFVIPNKMAAIPSSISYTRGGPAVFTHEMIIIIDQDATNDNRTALTNKINEAKAVSAKGFALIEAIYKAEEDNNLVSRKATLDSHIAALNAILATNDEIQDNLEAVSVVYHEASDKNTENTLISSIITNPFVYNQNNRTFMRFEVTDPDVTELDALIDTKYVYQVEDNIFDIEITSVKIAQYLELSYNKNNTPVQYNVVMTINPDATDDDRAQLTNKIAEAVAVANKDISLETAIQTATFDNNKTSHKETIVGHVTNLTDVIAANDSIKATLESASLTYVKSTDYNTSFDSSFRNFFSETQKYTVGNNKFIRVKIKNDFDLKLTVNSVNGKLAAYVYDESTLTHYIIDYPVASFIEPTISKVSYVSGAYSASHDQYIVIDHDATPEARTALKTAISDAEGTANKGNALLRALQDAKLVDHLLTRNADLIAKTNALRTAITNNVTPTDPGNVHPGSGLEVGNYMLPLTILHNTDNVDSYMQQYVRGEARLVVAKNSLTVHLLLGQTDMIKNFTVNGKKASESSTRYDEEAREYLTRYSFQVNSISDITNSSIHVESPIYIMTHPIRLSFGAPGEKVARFEKDRYDELAGVTTPPPTTPVVDEEETDTKPEENNNSNGSNNGGGSTTAPEVKFTDIGNSWAKENIERAVALNIVTGYADGSFKPNQVVNRAEFTAMIARALKLETKDTALQFKDNDKIGDWAKGYIQAAVTAGIINGFEDQSFRPTEEISRAQVTVMMIKALGIEPSEQYELTFADADTIPAYARKYVAAAVELGLIAGVGNNTFASNKAATRAEAITFNLRVIDFQPKQK